MKPVADYVASQNGTVVVEELPSWLVFFQKYVLQAEAVRILLPTYTISLQLTIIYLLGRWRSDCFGFPSHPKSEL
jgi:hypothetical protein